MAERTIEQCLYLEAPKFFIACQLRRALRQRLLGALQHARRLFLTLRDVRLVSAPDRAGKKFALRDVGVLVGHAATFTVDRSIFHSTRVSNTSLIVLQHA